MEDAEPDDEMTNRISTQVMTICSFDLPKSLLRARHVC